MSQLMLVNPRRRKRRSSGKRRKMTAKQAKYFAPRRRRAKSSSKRRARRSVATVARRVGRRVRRSARRFASNRSGSSKALSLKPAAFLKNTALPAAMGGAGALAIDVIWGMAPIPANLKTGPLAPLVKVAGAVGIGLLASRFAGKDIGAKVVGGYLTVLAYNLAKNAVQKAMPTLPLGDYDMGYIQSGQFFPDASAGMGVYLAPPAPEPAGMGSYISGYDYDGAAY